MVEEIIWPCKKCGLIRSNKHMHQHGIPLPANVLKAIEDRKIQTSAPSSREKEWKGIGGVASARSASGHMNFTPLDPRLEGPSQPGHDASDSVQTSTVNRDSARKR